MNSRKIARKLARKAIEENQPLRWFEELYHEGKNGKADIPWADMTPNPNLVEWLNRKDLPQGLKAIKIGCGLGDDSEELSKRGFEVDAFDISPTAIAWCKERFPDSKVNYYAEDLFNHEKRKYDLVLESYTLQVLTKALRSKGIAKIAEFVNLNGILLIICRGRDLNDEEGEMPWPLLKDEIHVFEKHNFRINVFEDYWDNEEPPVRRFRVEMIKT